MISSDTPSENNCISRSSERLSNGSTARSRSRVSDDAATGPEPTPASAKASIVSVILSSCIFPRGARRSAKGPRIVRRTSADTSAEPGSLRAMRRAATLTPWPRRSPFGCTTTSPRWTPTRTFGSHRSASASAASTAARVEPNSSMNPSPAVLNTRPPRAPAIFSITLRSAATSIADLASSASVRAA